MKFYNVHKIEKFGRPVSGLQARDLILKDQLPLSHCLVAVVSNGFDPSACDISEKDDFIGINICFLNGYFNSMKLYEVDQRALGDHFVFEEFTIQSKL